MNTMAASSLNRPWQTIPTILKRESESVRRFKLLTKSTYWKLDLASCQKVILFENFSVYDQY